MSGDNTRKAFNRFSTTTTTTKAILGTSHIIMNVLQSETLKPEWWDAPLIQEKYQGKGKL
jgi:hypothetical protein